MRLQILTRVEEARRGRGEDRIAVVELVDRSLVVVADGAGGVGGGARTAEAICSAVNGTVTDWMTWLSEQDTVLGSRGTGLAAVVAFSIADDGEIRGASVGDCEAWLFGQGDAVQLTAAQARKPLLGDGDAKPASFVATLSRGTFVVASDGLWKYMKLARIVEVSAMRPLQAAMAALVDGARLPSRGLQDDVAIVMCARDP